MTTPMPLNTSPYISPTTLITAPTGIDLGLDKYSAGR
jgi:hypothetical protein